MPYIALCQQKNCEWIVFARNKRAMDDLCEAHDLKSHNESFWQWFEITEAIYQRYRQLYNIPALRKALLQRIKQRFYHMNPDEAVLTLFAGSQ